jgi:hypothetical protein
MASKADWWKRRSRQVDLSAGSIAVILASGSHDVNDELQDLRHAGYKPVLVGPKPFSLEEILRHVDPMSDEETERFVAAIYADRRQAAENSSPK